MDTKTEQIAEMGFVGTVEMLQKIIHRMALEKGWWSGPRETGTIIALMHSELSEALEYARHDNPASDHIPMYSGVEEEMADVVIRIMDYCEHEGFDLAGAILAKVDFNSGRPHKHGGKAF